MQKVLWIFAPFMLICFSASAQFGKVEAPPPSWNLYVNALGFVQLGPTVGIERQQGNLIFDAHVRFHGLGLMSYVLAADPEIPNRIDATFWGGGIKSFWPTRNGGWYLGVLAEFSPYFSIYDQGGSYEWSTDSDILVFAASGGYRFQLNDRLFLNTGFIIGTAYEFNYTWYYSNPRHPDDGRRRHSDPGTYPFGMLELSLGLKL